MTNKTLLKARQIYKAGGVERVRASLYHVLSTSGETYAVELSLDRCTCATPKGMMCSHKGAVELARSARRKALVA